MTEQTKAFCPRCGGRGIIYTGITESPTTNCYKCEGVGLVDPEQKPEPISNLRFKSCKEEIERRVSDLNMAMEKYSKLGLEIDAKSFYQGSSTGKMFPVITVKVFQPVVSDPETK